MLLVVNEEAQRNEHKSLPEILDALPVPTYITFERRQGFATVRNCALDWAEECQVILFLDDDTVVESRWIQNMWEESIAHPSQIIGSQHVRVASVPEDQVGIDRIAAEVRHTRLTTLSGTNGLLLPLGVVGQLRFNVLYNDSGGEDTEFLLRLHHARYPELHAQCVAVEEDRMLLGSWTADASFAFDRGQLWISINRNLGRRTMVLRVRAFIGLLPAAVLVCLSALQPQPTRRRRLRLLAVRLGVLFANAPRDQGALGDEGSSG